MEPKSFVSSLLDLSFSSFVTTRIISLIYVLALIGVVIAAIAMVIGGLTQGVGAALGGLLGGALTLVLGTIGCRVYCELIIVLFKIAENTGRMAGTHEPAPDA